MGRCKRKCYVATIERLIAAMNKKNITLEQAINLVISSTEEIDIATVAIGSVADTEQKKSF
ncbi:hypothetical protein COM96_20495 [Bacillus cereus]|uniref:Uncharacterized protein n=1 Tax=Bacillus cereus TaxID=1396 RepID=A0A2A7HTE2_BACCE|nr:hypothetical protein COM96_20495 [Bacillus cereus]